jgi:solute carrier family 10 (sodium/bile acid cotransporter), member 7
MQLKKLLKDQVFLILIILVMLFSFLFPQPGQLVKEAGLMSVFTFIAMFLSGLTLSFANVKSSLKDYKTILAAVFITFVLFPALAYGLTGLLLPGKTDLFVGAMIISTQASTVSSAIVLTMAANGNVPLAIIITVINNFLSVFISPFALNLVFSLKDKITFDVPDMILNLVYVVIVPIVIAQLLKFFLKERLDFIKPIKKPIASFVVLMFVLIGASTAAPQIGGNLDAVLLVIVFAIILHVLVLAVGLLYSRLTRQNQANIPSLIFCSAEKTMTSSILVWGNYFAGYLLAPIVIVFYHMTQIFIDSIIANSFAKRVKAPGE